MVIIPPENWLCYESLYPNISIISMIISTLYKIYIRGQRKANLRLDLPLFALTYGLRVGIFGDVPHSCMWLCLLVCFNCKMDETPSSQSWLAPEACLQLDRCIMQNSALLACKTLFISTDRIFSKTTDAFWYQLSRWRTGNALKLSDVFSDEIRSDDTLNSSNVLCEQEEQDINRMWWRDDLAKWGCEKWGNVNFYPTFQHSVT